MAGGDEKSDVTKHRNLDGKRARRAASLQLFVKQYGRKTHKGHDPNDRRYSRGIEQVARRMSPDEFDSLLRDGEDD